MGIGYYTNFDYGHPFIIKEESGIGNEKVGRKQTFGVTSENKCNKRKVKSNLGV